MIKIHIDHIDNEDGRVWAVQDGKKYYRVHGIIVEGVDLYTRRNKRQPRAFLAGKGKVKILNTEGRLLAVITGK